MTTRKELGEILLEADLISRSQLDEALGLQKAYGERLASVLVRKRMLTEKFAVTYLGRQVGVPGLDLSRAEIDLSALELLPLDLCERHLIFPVRVEGDRLHIAMVDPTDRLLLTRIEGKTGWRLAPMVALESSIKRMIRAARRAENLGERTISLGPPASSAADADAGPVTSARPGADSESKDKGDGPLATEIAVGAVVPTRPPLREESLLVLVALKDAPAWTEIEQLLVSHGHRCLHIGPADDILGQSGAGLAHAVVLDAEWAGSDGLELCRQLKQAEGLRGTPVLLLVPNGLGWRFAADVREQCDADEVLERAQAPAELLRRLDLLTDRTPDRVAPEAESILRQHLKDGVVALKQGRPAEAITLLRRGLEIDPENDLLHYYLGMACEKTGQFMPAVEHYERAVHANPDFYDAIVSLANLYQGRQFRRKAAEMWELALTATHDDGVRQKIREHILSLL